MGAGYIYNCSSCGKHFAVHTGVGYLFPKVYADIIADVQDGGYGENWKNAFTRAPYMAIDASSAVYICGSCGYWEEAPVLALYSPKDPEQLKSLEYHGKTVEEWGFVPYVLPADLKDKYRFVKNYRHVCPGCNKQMRKAKDEELQQLSCPGCDHAADRDEYTMSWD